MSEKIGTEISDLNRESEKDRELQTHLSGCQILTSKSEGARALKSCSLSRFKASRGGKSQKKQRVVKKTYSLLTVFP